jgi:hypothetical protein
LREDGKAIEREIVTPDGARHLVVVDDPETQWITANGTVYDSNNHRIAHGPPPGGTHAITEQNARQYQAARYDKAERSAREALAHATGQPNAYAGWSEVIKNQVRISTNPDSPYSTNAAKFVGSAAGLLRDRREGDKTDGVTLSIDADVARMLIDRISKLRQGDV